MTFKDYILTLDGKECIVYISELSFSLNATDAKFALCGLVEAHDDFIVIHSDDSGAGTAVQIKDIKCIETCELDEDFEDEDLEEDIFSRFERFYKDFKGE